MATHGIGATRRRMEQTVDDTRRRLASLRAGRATPDLVASLRVRAWGNELPLDQVAQIGVQPPRGLIITPHDPSLVAEVERAIADSDIGARPRVDGQRLRLEVPAPTQERRVELAKQARDAAEDARVAIRLARRDCVNELRRMRSAEEISEAKLNGRSKDVQALTDEHVVEVERLLELALAAIAE